MTVARLCRLRTPLLGMPVASSHFHVRCSPSSQEYCPQVFRNLRERFGLDDGCFLKSLTQCPKKSDPASGRSAAKCYLSHDKMYVIKSLTSEEVSGARYAFLVHVRTNIDLSLIVNALLQFNQMHK